MVDIKPFLLATHTHARTHTHMHTHARAHTHSLLMYAGNSTSTKSNLSKILIPVAGVGGLLLGATVVLVLVAILFIYFKKRNARAFTFQRMAFNDVRDDDDE